mgnify:FL=1
MKEGWLFSGSGATGVVLQEILGGKLGKRSRWFELWVAKHFQEDLGG